MRKTAPQTAAAATNKLTTTVKLEGAKMLKPLLTLW